MTITPFDIQLNAAAMQARHPLLSVAPMMDWTDRHCRYFHRLIAPSFLLYTEMVTTGALIHGDAERHLRFNEPEEHPVALQLGGSEPEALAACARMGEDAGYDEINLNCGCPSDRVQRGRFGACLMAEPDLVAESMAAMRNAVSVPVTIKCRIAIDEEEEFPFLNRFINKVSQAGCKIFIIHARKAWLNGLSPKENRTVPPLRYDLVQRIKDDYPNLTIILNGGLSSVDMVKGALAEGLDGAMIGREAYQNPWFLHDLQNECLDPAKTEREAVARAMIPYIQDQYKRYGTPTKTITRHMVGLFSGLPGAKQWRRSISEHAHKDTGTGEVIEMALHAMKTRKAA